MLFEQVFLADVSGTGEGTDMTAADKEGDQTLRDQVSREIVAREGQRRKDIRAMVAHGLPVDQVADILGITTDEVNAIVSESPEVPVQVSDGQPAELADLIAALAQEAMGNGRSDADEVVAAQAVHMFASDEGVRAAAWSREKFFRDRISRLAAAREEGRKEGLAQVRNERIRAALAMGLPADQVSIIFGVTPDEVTAVGAESAPDPTQQDHMV